MWRGLSIRFLTSTWVLQFGPLVLMAGEGGALGPLGPSVGVYRSFAVCVRLLAGVVLQAPREMLVAPHSSALF